ncbi:cryptic autophosphorylating protein tyrosine kinase Etk [Mariprofundus micogutta]|uniref:Cryptic autophosphorylating protein tyrosine kinase Etk n=1 Tax=Mariprofundus micogutta TaxID=1921010 RepID=A0A1L8CLV1_9PROT|nr:Wzz/FepE/Etk N-terminal domain-containing protein [Mariprofundus micogutta]GAV19881.1 cryptic autophosphorylating protein tyrosine kinase Etk [Mariprofundus micogutta]
MTKKNKQQHEERPQSPVHQPQIDPQMLAAMYGMQQNEDEIHLLQYWRAIWKRKVVVIAVSFIATMLVAGYSLTLPNIYRADVLLAPVADEGAKRGPSLGGLGSLASLAGISLGGGGNIEENLAVLKSRDFLWKFIKAQKLMPILFEDEWDEAVEKWKELDPEDQPNNWDAYRRFTEVLSVSVDKKSNLVTMSIEWKSAELASAWVNLLVDQLNEHLRQRAVVASEGNLKYLYNELARTQVEDMRRSLFELIAQEQRKAMLANSRKQFAFQVLDAAAPPDNKYKPKRTQLALLAGIIFGFLAMVGILIAERIRNRCDDGQFSQR